MNRKKTHGFTLVELLVVIGIIALLISVLLPALGKAREQANLVACAANMRSVSQAVFLYQAENKGSFPPSAASVDTNGTAPNYGMGTHWIGHIWTRLKLPQGGIVRACPTTLALIPQLPISSSYLKGAYASYQYSVLVGGMENS